MQVESWLRFDSWLCIFLATEHFVIAFQNNKTAKFLDSSGIDIGEVMQCWGTFICEMSTLMSRLKKADLGGVNTIKTLLTLI